jgi:hypothetical protein
MPKPLSSKHSSATKRPCRLTTSLNEFTGTTLLGGLSSLAVDGVIRGSVRFKCTRQGLSPLMRVAIDKYSDYRDL